VSRAHTEKDKARAAARYVANKAAINAKHREYRAANKEKIKKTVLEWRAANKEHLAAYYARTREKRLAYKMAYRAGNKEKIAAYKAANKERDAAYKAEYRAANKEKRAAYLAVNREKIAARQATYETAWRKAKMKADPSFKLRVALRIRALHALKHQRVTKSFQSHNRLLGGTIEQARQHIENQFEPWMSWENHGFRGWHIDHVKPLATFDLTDPAQVAKAFHYKNLRPLHWRKNLAKGAKAS